MIKVLIPLAQGCEELEAVTLIDLLRRAGITVITAGLDNQPVTCSRKTVLIPDTSLEQIQHEEFDLIVLPGGLPGADNLSDDERIIKLIRIQAENEKLVGAICAAPKVLAKANLLNNRKVTSFPGALADLDLPSTEITGANIERDGNIITSRGPGTAMDFALELIGLLAGDEARDTVARQMVR